MKLNYTILILFILLIITACGGGDSGNNPRISARAATDYYDTIQQTYIAYYGRPADPGGLAYWAGKLNDAGGDLSEIIEPFGNSDEYVSRFGSLNNTELVTQIFQQTINRVPDQLGLEFYVSWLDSGTATLASIALNVMYGAVGDDATIIANKLSAANTFTSRIMYGDTSYPDIDNAVSFLSGIDATSESVVNVTSNIDNYLISGSSNSSSDSENNVTPLSSSDLTTFEGQFYISDITLEFTNGTTATLEDFTYFEHAFSYQVSTAREIEKWQYTLDRFEFYMFYDEAIGGDVLRCSTSDIEIIRDNAYKVTKTNCLWNTNIDEGYNSIVAVYTKISDEFKVITDSPFSK